jgi:hypothetical protein
MNEILALTAEDSLLRESCNLCGEAPLAVGQKTDYGAVIIYKNGNTQDGWFATLSPKAGGLEKDFTIQLNSNAHFTHFSQLDAQTAQNYGVAFAAVSRAMTVIMMSDDPIKAASETREESASVATYGKCTTWKEKKEHVHIKVFPFRGNIGQPYTVDSTFGRKKVYKDSEGEFVKMNAVKKVMISNGRFNVLSKKLIELLNG